MTKGEWRQGFVNFMSNLSPAERVSFLYDMILSRWCQYCGEDQTGRHMSCQCTNDE